MADENKQPQPNQFRWVKPTEPKPEIYTNFVHPTWTLFDVRFLLGQLVPTEPGASLEFVVQPQGAVTISWAEAKILRDFLVSLIENYEKTNGEIKPLKLVPAPEVPKPSSTE